MREACRHRETHCARDPKTEDGDPELAREYVKAQSMATVAGFKPPPQDVSQLAREPSHYDNLDDNFRGLAENYRLLIQAIGPLSETPLYRSLRGRAQVHLAQAEAVRRPT
jgi:hypothetical protein